MSKGWIATISVATVLAFSAGFLFWVVKGNQLREDLKIRPVLHVFTYDSFAASTGPASEIKELFERRCQCEVKFLGGGESTLIVRQAMRQKNRQPIDVIVGVDQYALTKALKTISWKQLDVPSSGWESALSNAFAGLSLVPVDWAPLAILYRSDTGHSFSSLEKFKRSIPERSLTLQDPRSSTPGLQFTMWVEQLVGKEDFQPWMKSLNPKVHSYSPSWSLSYGLFKAGQATYTFSYLTSLVYHWLQEQGQESFKAMRFDEGHPIQVEFAGVPDFCRECDLAKDFVKFLLSPPAQKIIMERNYMFPVLREVRAGTVFEKLPDLKLLKPEIATEGHLEELIKSWMQTQR